MPNGTLILRADASIAMGTGHVMRCLALAQAWQDQAWQDQAGQCIFAMAETTAASQERIRGDRFETLPVAAIPGSLQDAAQVVKLARARNSSWIVLDGYQFDVEYQRRLKAAGLKVLMVDDTGHAGAYVADLVLDQNAHATKDFYQQRESYSQLLLGPRYALLRREFRPWREWKREIAPVARKVLLTVGGSDPDNVSIRIIRGLGLLAENNLETTIVAGGANPHIDSLEEEIGRMGGRFRLVRDTFDMPRLMADADVAISAAGITCWELCLLGLPAVLIDVAENQTPVAHELERRGVAIYAGRSQQVTPEEIAARLRLLLAVPERRAAMSERGRRLVDGGGAERVVSAMQPLILHLRPAERKDCRLLWEWANDPVTRAAAFSTEAIPWEHHQAWFEDKMEDPNCLLLIGENSEGRPVGQIRLDLRSEQEGEIDVSVSPDARGSGVGSRLIDLGVREAFARTDAECLHAFIRRENEMSVRAFERAHFLKVGEDVVKLQPALHYCRSKNSRPI
ncbi:MAG: UDP-2,4-diacetamido-2,4,6-trideoxy-beta-L-altropyranose hydrolase [Terriglobales bacterium]